MYFFVLRPNHTENVHSETVEPEKNPSQEENANQAELDGTKKIAKPEHICCICNKSFANSNNLERHKLIHENDESRQKAFQCTVCGWYFV